jgi:kynureninase
VKTPSLEDYRRHFPSLERSCYLISNSLGAMPAAAADELADYARAWSERGVRAWAEEWWDLGSDVADRIAPILGVPLGSVAMQPNVTTATAVFLSCLRPHRERRRIVTTDLQFPSILYLLDGWCRDHQVELLIVPSAESLGVSIDELVATIDERTLAVVVSHVEFKTAYVNDAQDLAHRCRQRGARLLLDVFQSAGVLPLELAEWQVDAAVGGCLKWLCGGPGAAYLYVEPQLCEELEPRLTGWMAHHTPFAFAPPPIQLQKGARRFLNGTPPIAAFYAARPGLDMIAEIGAATIRHHSLELTKLLLEEATSRGWRTATPSNASQRAGTVAVQVPSGDRVARELLERDVIVDYRPGAGIRIAPHFYNRADECLHCVEQIEAILADGSFRRHPESGGGQPT